MKSVLVAPGLPAMNAPALTTRSLSRSRASCKLDATSADVVCRSSRECSAVLWATATAANHVPALPPSSSATASSHD